MKMISIGEHNFEHGTFLVHLLKKAGIHAELHPLVHSSKDEWSRRTDIIDPFPGWNPTHALMVYEKDKDIAKKIIHKLLEFNWYEKKPKIVDVSKDVFPQLYGIKPFKEKKK